MTQLLVYILRGFLFSQRQTLTYIQCIDSELTRRFIIQDNDWGSGWEGNGGFCFSDMNKLQLKWKLFWKFIIRAKSMEEVRTFILQIGIAWVFLEFKDCINLSLCPSKS